MEKKSLIIKTGMNDLGSTYKVKHQFPTTVKELDEFWEEMEGKMTQSVMYERRRVWRKDKSFKTGYDEDLARKIYWILVQSVMIEIAPEITKEELSSSSYLKSKKDSNVYRIDFDEEKCEFEYEYYITDILYRDTIKLSFNKTYGWIIEVTKWMKFPIPIKEFSFIANQGKMVMDRQWKEYVRNIEKGIMQERSGS